MDGRGTMRIRTTMYAEFGLLEYDGVAMSASPSPSLGALAGFLLFPPGAIYLRTGVNMGPVLVDVEPCDTTPPRDDEAWEEIVEFSAHRINDVPVALHGPTELPPADASDLCSGDAPFVGIRVSATGRDRARDIAVSEPTEHYLVQIWPTRAATDPKRIKGSVEPGSITSMTPTFSARAMNEPTRVEPDAADGLLVGSLLWQSDGHCDTRKDMERIRYQDPSRGSRRKHHDGGDSDLPG